MSRIFEALEDGVLMSIYHVKCCFCNKILVVNVPQRSLSANVLVRCAHCTNVLTVDMVGSDTSEPLQLPSGLHVGGPAQQTVLVNDQFSARIPVGTSITPHNPPAQKRTKTLDMAPELADSTRGKKSRNPSAYNIFIREEIQRIKARNPNIDHKQAFSTAAKNWASCPQLCIDSAQKTDMFEGGALTVYTDDNDDAQSSQT